MNSPNPSNELTPAAIAISLLGDGEDDAIGIDGTPDAVAVALFVAVVVIVDLMITGVAVAVDVIVTVVVSVLLGDVEPDVRLNITSPASMEKGDELPLVLVKQVLLNGFMLPQQKKGL